ncbi:MAG: beta-lactamase family protein [Xanthomonadales bacterium]|nr:beta-lactamase family protein [Xanthomonadales bacterium]
MGVLIRQQARERRYLQHALFAVACMLALSVTSADPSVSAASPALRAVNPQAQGFSAERLQRLQDYLGGLVDSGQVPGYSALLARKGQVVWAAHYGMADDVQRVPLSEDSIFRVYSQTKVVTGVALMMLFEQGKWHFDDPITKYIPEFEHLRVFKQQNPDGSLELEDLQRPPTMRELVTHAAGFGYGLGKDTPVEAAYWNDHYIHSASTDAAIAKLAELPMASQPGLHWHYSAAVDVQGYIIERISGQRLDEFMQNHVFGPLGMTDTAFHVPADKWSRLVRLRAYDSTTRTLVDASDPVLVLDYSKPPAVASGGAGLVSTVHDFARFAQVLVNDGELDGVRILSPAAVKLLCSNQLSEQIRSTPGEGFNHDSGWGFGVDVAVITDQAKAGTLRPAGSYEWGGAAGTWFWVDPVNDLIFIGMIQVMNRWGHPQLVNIDKDSAALVYGALVEPEAARH